MAYYPDQPDDLPKAEDLLKYITRKIDLEDKDDKELFFWYVEKVLPCGAGALEWNDRKKYNEPISKAKMKKYPSKKIVTMATEAFIYALWDNCWEKWVAVRKYVKQNNKRPEKRTKENKNDDVYKTKYTKQDGGQQPFGGWDDQGQEKYHEVLETINTARKDSNYFQVEKDVIPLLREERKLDEEDANKPPPKAKKVEKKRKHFTINNAYFE